MTFWLKNLHRTLSFYVTTFITVILYLPFWQEQHLIKMSPTKLKTTAVTMYSPLKLGHPTDTWLCECESRLNETKKRQFNMYENKRWWNWMLPGIVPLVIEAKWTGQHIVQNFQDGTGQHEKVQLHFWGLRWGKGNCDGASVTWSPHSLGRSHHQTLHSQGHLSFVLSNHLQVQPLSSSSFLCFAVKANTSHFKRFILYITSHLKLGWFLLRAYIRWLI